jgi:hypothetical protein
VDSEAAIGAEIFLDEASALTLSVNPDVASNGAGIPGGLGRYEAQRWTASYLRTPDIRHWRAS